MLNKKKRAEKIQMKKTIKQHEERDIKAASTSAQPDQALPTYLLDRENQKDAKALSSAVKERRKDKAARYSVPLPQVRGIAEDEAFRVMKSGKRKSKAWKRMVTKATFVGESFTRKPPKLERFIRPMGLRYKKAHITHPDLKATFQLPIIGVKKNPQSPMYTQLGVLTKGTIIEVNVSELGMVTTGGKVVWGKYAQITNNPVSCESCVFSAKACANITLQENDGCINGVLLLSSCTLDIVDNHHPPSHARQLLSSGFRLRLPLPLCHPAGARPNGQGGHEYTDGGDQPLE